MQHKVIGTALAQNLLLACNSTIPTRDMLGSAQLLFSHRQVIKSALVWSMFVLNVPDQINVWVGSIELTEWQDEDQHSAVLFEGTCLKSMRQHLHYDVFNAKTERFVFVLPIHVHKYNENHLKMEILKMKT